MKQRTRLAALTVGSWALWLGAAALSSCSSDDAPGAPTGSGGNASADSGTGTTGGGAGTNNGGTAGGSGSGGAGPSGSSGVGGSGAAGGSGGATGGGQTGGSGGAAGTSAGGSIADGGAARGDAGGSGTMQRPEGGAGANADAGNASVSFNPSRAAISGVRGVASPPASQTLQLHNSGSAAVQITALTLGGMHAALFRLTSPAQLPATIAAGGDLAVTLTMDTGSTLPAAPANKDSGVTFLTAELSVASSAGAVQLPVFGLAAQQANYEATFGQILTALGYPLNVGKAQNNWNWNGSTVTTLGGVEPGTDEVAAPLFVKAGAGNVSLVPIARFSPVGEMAFGWYPPGMATMRTRVGAMAEIADAQTSNKARLIYPPLVAPGTTTFDPGTMPFGIWAFTAQGAAGTVHGDYNYSQDALNVPAPGIHRFKAFPLKDAAGPIANTFMLGVEEASNGDYQDYVFILSNVRVAP